MGFWRDAAFTAAGYGIHELVDRKREKSAPTKTWRILSTTMPMRTTFGAETSISISSC